MTEEENDKDVNVNVETTQGVWKTVFQKTTKIQEVIEAIKQHFGFAADGNYELRLSTDPDNALKAGRPLVSYGIIDGAILVFTDLGVAV